MILSLANQIAHDALGKTLDELPPQTESYWIDDADGEAECECHGIDQPM